MPTYLTPGVYVEEVPAQSKPIEGVATSVAAFVGLAPGGPVNTPVQIANWTQFARTFSSPARPEDGPFMPGAYLAHSVYGYFQNGGGLCWVVRVGGDGNGRPAAQAGLPAASAGDVETFRAIAADGVDGEISVELVEERPAEEPKGEAKEGETGPTPEPPTYRLVVEAGSLREEYDGLTLKRGRTNLATKVNQSSKLIHIEDVGESLPDTQRAPAPGRYALRAPGAEVGDAKPGDFEGDVAQRRGIGGLAAVDEITMVCAPDLMMLLDGGDDTLLRDQQNKLIVHCERAGDRMAILDAPPGLLPRDVLDWRMNAANFDSKFATLYYPWLEVMDPVAKPPRPIMVPPSGHIAGIWARTDNTRGVHKAPANEVVLGANGLAFQITGEEQGDLNKNGINCIRTFPGRGIRVWGARTLSSDPEWIYLNVRRLFNYISESIMQGTQWAVFEPNDAGLWLQLRIAATNFLTRVWRDGALFGAVPEEAFFVKCDAETNPPDQIEVGQVVVEIGIAPVKPAEFVIFRISQFSAGAAEVSA
jgi:uncharacterized protein